MDEELIRAACESANCKYPDMEAMANFKREVTPSAVIGLLDGLRHAKGIAAINDARANGAAETIQHLRDDIAKLRAQLPSQGGEAVAWRVTGGDGLTVTAQYPAWAETDCLLTITPLYTHPADQVAECERLLDLLADWSSHFTGPKVIGGPLSSLRERTDAALLNGGRS